MMRVGIDAQIARASKAGIGQFTAALVEWLPKVDRSAEYIPLAPDRVDRDFTMPERIWWDQVRIPQLVRRERIDVLLKPAFSVPVISKAPTVAVLHDLAARRFSEQLHKPSAWFYGHWCPWTFRFAKKIIAASAFTANEAATLLRIPKEKMSVVVQGRDELASPDPQPQDAQVMEKFRLPEQYILHVGTLEPRKNLPFLIRTYARFREQHAEYGLVLVGLKGWMSNDLDDTVQELHLGGAVRWIGSVTDEERRAIYRHARLLAFPSMYEGFGRPPLEAMGSGVPVVASRAGAIPEVVGGAGILLQGYDEAAWAEAFRVAADDAERRTALRQSGLERSAQFSWERACKAISSVIHGVAV